MLPPSTRSTRRLAATVLCCGAALWLAGAGCGKPFTYAGGAGGGGSAATGDPTTTTSSGSSSGASACTFDGQQPCAADEYCATTDCEKGTCQPRPAPKGQAWDPVCSCDGVIYWNVDLALAAGVGFLDSASCDSSKLQTCTPLDNPCDHKKNVWCSLQSNCAGPPTGNCVKLPGTCDGTTRGGMRCIAPNGCEPTCKLIKDEKPWYLPSPACSPP